MSAPEYVPGLQLELAFERRSTRINLRFSFSH